MRIAKDTPLAAVTRGSSPNLRRAAGFLLVMLLQLVVANGAVGAEYAWQQLPALPDAEGFAGPYAGVAGGSLLVAGGANFPDARPWDGGAKVWYDTVFILDNPDGSWRTLGRLPRPMGYGVSVTTDAGVLCIGGSDATGHYADCFLLKWDGQQLRVEDYPPLPSTCANMCGVLAGRTVYVCGGTETPTSTTALKTLWKLDLDHVDAGWQTLPELPGPGRLLPTAAYQSGKLYVVGGASLHADADGKPARTYLTDGYSFTEKTGWQSIQDLPRPAVAAPSPAPAVGVSHFLLMGGDDGKFVDFEPKTEHPGFPRDVLAYETVTDTWVVVETLPKEVHSPVTVPVVQWQDRWVLPSGEVSPGIRTPAVMSLQVTATSAAFGVINWVIVAIYLGGMIAVGWWFMQHDAASTTEGYFRGGQKIPGWVAGLSIFATMLSSLTFMGIPARAYRTDISWYIGQLPILIVVPLVICFYLPFFRSLNVTSAYEYLEKRFNLQVRLFASASFILYHIGRIAIVLYLPALALAAVSDIGVIPAILVIGVLCLIYTVMGGITAVVWTDAIQAIVLMCGATLCCVLAAIRADGGIAGVARVAMDDDKLLQSLQWDSINVDNGTASVWVIFVAFLFNALVPYTSGQDVVQRYVTTKDLPTARRSLWLTMWMSVFGSLIFFLMGTAIYAFYKSHPGDLDPTLAGGDSILPFYIMQQLPVGISGVVIAAIFAASQSTISSSLNSIATAWITDVDARLLRPGREDHVYLQSARNVVVLIGTIGIGVACWMAFTKIDSAFKTFNEIIGLTAGSLGGVFALGVFTKRANGTGALIGAVAGIAVVLTLKFTAAPVTGLMYACIGLTTCFVMGYVSSLPGGIRTGEPKSGMSTGWTSDQA